MIGLKSRNAQFITADGEPESPSHITKTGHLMSDKNLMRPLSARGRMVLPRQRLAAPACRFRSGSAATIGGGARSAELTLPGFRNDVCSAVHPMAVCLAILAKSAARRPRPVWVHPPTPLPTRSMMGRSHCCGVPWTRPPPDSVCDAAAYRRLIESLVSTRTSCLPTCSDHFVGPDICSCRHTGRQAIRSGRGLAEAHFEQAPARALIAGLAGHAVLPFGNATGGGHRADAGNRGHAVGWPLPRGGAQRLS